MVTSSMTFHGHFMMTFDGHFTMTFHGHFSLPYDFGVLRLVSLHPFTHLLPATRPKNPTKHPSPTNSPLTTILPHTDVHPLSPKHQYDQGPPHTTSHLPSTTITPITLSDLFLFSRTQMSTHHHLNTTITRAPPHLPHPTSLPLPSPPIALFDLFLFSRNAGEV